MNLSIYGDYPQPISAASNLSINNFKYVYFHFVDVIRFNWLPVVEDEEEAVHVYGYLCDLIQANHPIILGASNTNLPRIVCIIAEAFYRDVIGPSHEVGRRMVEIVKQIEQNPDVFQACLGLLSVEQKQALEDAYRELAAIVA